MLCEGEGGRTGLRATAALPSPTGNWGKSAHVHCSRRTLDLPSLSPLFVYRFASVSNPLSEGEFSSDITQLSIFPLSLALCCARQSRFLVSCGKVQSPCAVDFVVNNNVMQWSLPFMTSSSSLRPLSIYNPLGMLGRPEITNCRGMVLAHPFLQYYCLSWWSSKGESSLFVISSDKHYTTTHAQHHNNDDKENLLLLWPLSVILLLLRLLIGAEQITRPMAIVTINRSAKEVEQTFWWTSTSPRFPFLYICLL